MNKKASNCIEKCSLLSTKWKFTNVKSKCHERVQEQTSIKWKSLTTRRWIGSCTMKAFKGMHCVIHLWIVSWNYEYIFSKLNETDFEQVLFRLLFWYFGAWSFSSFIEIVNFFLGKIQNLSSEICFDYFCDPSVHFLESWTYLEILKILWRRSIVFACYCL